MPTVKTVTALAKAIGVSQPRVSQRRKEAWFPKGPPWDVDEVRELWVANVGQAGGKVEQAAGGQVRRPAPRHQAAERPDPADDSGDDLGSGDPCAVARAAVRIAAQAVERASEGDGFGPREMTALRDALSELRRTEKGFDEIRVRRGELVERQQVLAEMGELVGLLIGGLERLTASIGTQLVQWLADEELRGLSAKRQALVGQQWAQERSDRVRAGLAEAVGE